jgi:hypothetical protein
MIVNLRDSVGHDYHNIFLRFAQLPLCPASARVASSLWTRPIPDSEILNLTVQKVQRTSCLSEMLEITRKC